MQHKVTVRFDDELYTQIVGHELNPSDLLRTSVRQFLNPKIENIRQVVGQDEIKDEMYTPINSISDISDDRYLKHLEGEIAYLRGIHNKVMDRVTLLPEAVEMPQSAVSDVPSANSRDTIGDEINHVIKERSEDIVKTEKKKGFLGRLWG